MKELKRRRQHCWRCTSIDSRPGSNSVFLANDTLTFDQMIEKAKAIFPEIVARFTFEIVTLPPFPHPFAGDLI